MKKKRLVRSRFRELGKQLCRIMKLTVLIFFCFIFYASGETYSQSSKMSLSLKNITVKEALNEIEEQSDFIFLYKIEELDEMNFNEAINESDQNPGY